MIRSFGRRTDALDDIFGFVSEFVAVHGMPSNRALDLQFVVEELFTNMLKYNRDGKREIAIGIHRCGDRIEVALTDFGVEPFDITGVPEPDLERPFEERRPGGLGLLLVRRLSESLEYRHANGNSTVVVTMRR